MIKVHVSSEGEAKAIETREWAEVKELKAAVAEAFGLPLDRVNLMYDGQHLHVRITKVIVLDCLLLPLLTYHLSRVTKPLEPTASTMVRR